MEVTAVIPAAGKGTRMKDEFGKPFLPLKGRPILAHTLDVFEGCDAIDRITLVIAAEMVDRCRAEIIDAFNYSKVKKVVSGGEQRQDSVYIGLKAIEEPCEIVVVHDGVRPFVTAELIARSVEMCRKHKAVISAVPPKDTIKRGEKGYVVSTLDRAKLWMVQTPQTFAHDVIRRAYERAYDDRFRGTDDASLVERLGVRVKILEGSYDNIKITTQEDVYLAERLLEQRME